MAKPLGSEKVGGRQKGTPNKLTKDLKAMLLGSLDAVGGQAYFERQAEENPTAYMTLIGKLIPSEISKTVEVKQPKTIRIIKAEEMQNG
jgi:hypothetical protein